MLYSINEFKFKVLLFLLEKMLLLSHKTMYEFQVFVVDFFFMKKKVYFIGQNSNPLF